MDFLLQYGAEITRAKGNPDRPYACIKDCIMPQLLPYNQPFQLPS
jgi:hypothetical protein